tara:strand:+ start:2747 stop:3301 length:555 start_codon:yes stop_codon:yes gene_type:complete
MISKYIILDDLVKRVDQKRIEDLFLSDIPKWERIVGTTPGAKTNIWSREKDIPWFSHEMIEEYRHLSRFTGAVWDIFNHLSLHRYDDYLRTKHLGRLRCNLVPPQRGIKYYNTTPRHTDANCDHCVMIYYVNDCDGETILHNNGKIKPKRGRIVLFDGLIPHKIRYPTKGYRCVLNFNFMRTDV